MPSTTASWRLKEGWEGFVGPGPFTDAEFKAACQAYADVNGWTLDEVLRDQHVYEQDGASAPAKENQ